MPGAKSSCPGLRVAHQGTLEDSLSPSCLAQIIPRDHLERTSGPLSGILLGAGRHGLRMTIAFAYPRLLVDLPQPCLVF